MSIEINNTTIVMLGSMNEEFSRLSNIMEKTNGHMDKMVGVIDSLGGAVNSLTTQVTNLTSAGEWIATENIKQIESTREDIQRLDEQINNLSSIYINGLAENIENISANSSQMLDTLQSINDTITQISSNSDGFTDNIADAAEPLEKVKTGMDSVSTSTEELKNKNPSGIFQGMANVAGNLSTAWTRLINTSPLDIFNRLKDMTNGVNRNFELCKEATTILGDKFKNFGGIVGDVGSKLKGWGSTIKETVTLTNISNAATSAATTVSNGLKNVWNGLINLTPQKVFSAVGEAMKTAITPAEGYQKAIADLKDSLSGVGEKIIGLINPTGLLQSVMGKATDFLDGASAAWEAQSEAEDNLARKMRNTIQAGTEEIEAIKDMTSAQEKLGVVSKNVQNIGAAELAGFVKKSDELQTLLPLMNDLIVQENGLSASQTDAAAAAQLMGSALNGEIKGLENCGVKFTEAQKKVLVYGKESEKIATLAEAMQSSIGGVNEALGATPEGKMQQHTNAMEGLQARVGSLYEQVMISLLPLFDAVSNGIDKVVTLFEKHQGKITNVVNAIAKVCSKGFDIIIGVVTTVVSGIAWFYDTLMEGQPLLWGLVSILGLVALQLGFAAAQTAILTAATTIASTAQGIWNAAQALFNVIMAMNPIGLVIIGIIALISVIGYVCTQVESWGWIWDNTVNFMKDIFSGFVEAFTFQITMVKNLFLNVLDTLQLAWIKFKKFCGLGNKEENEIAIGEIQGRIESRQQEVLEGAQKVGDKLKQAGRSFLNIGKRPKAEGEVEEAVVEDAAAQEATPYQRAPKNISGLIQGVDFDVNSTRLGEQAAPLSGVAPQDNTHMDRQFVYGGTAPKAYMPSGEDYGFTGTELGEQAAPLSAVVPQDNTHLDRQFVYGGTGTKPYMPSVEDYGFTGTELANQVAPLSAVAPQDNTHMNRQLVYGEEAPKPYIPSGEDYGFTGTELANQAAPLHSIASQDNTRLQNGISPTLTSPEAGNMVSSISAGGEQGKSVVINFGAMVESLIFNGDFEEKREDMQKELENTLINVLQMAYSAQ